MIMEKFYKLCRACNIEKANLLSLHANDCDGEPTLGEMYMAITMSTLKATDDLPHQICYQCAKKLEAAFLFQKLCRTNERKLHQVLVRQHSRESTSRTHDAGTNTVLKLENFDPTEDSVTKKKSLLTGFPPINQRKIKRSAGSLLPTAKFPKITAVASITRQNGSRQLFICLHCKKRFLTINALSIHKKVHDKIKNQRIQVYRSYACEICNERFTSAIFLEEHHKNCATDKLEPDHSNNNIVNIFQSISTAV